MEEDELRKGGFKEFFNDIGIALTSFSIFLFIFFEIIKSDYINSNLQSYNIFISLLFGLIFVIALFIALHASSFKNIIIRIFGLVILSLPFLFYEVLEESLKSKLDIGIYVVLGAISLFSGIGIMVLIFQKIENKFSDIRGFYFYNAIVSITFFTLFKYFSFAVFIYKFIPNYTGLVEAIIVGLKIGLSIGLVISPALIVLNKISFWIESKQKKRKSKKRKIKSTKQRNPLIMFKENTN